MPPTKTQVENAIDTGIKALRTLVREVKRPGGGALMMDGPALPISRIIPQAGGVVGTSGTASRTGVTLSGLVVSQPYEVLTPGAPGGGIGHDSDAKVESLGRGLETEGSHKLYWEEYKYTFKYRGSDDSQWQVRYEARFGGSAGDAFENKSQAKMRCKNVVSPVHGGVLALDDFAVVPKSSSYTDIFLKETTAVSPVVDYCLHAGVYPVRYQRNSAQILRAIALREGTPDDVRLSEEITKFTDEFEVTMSLYDGFFSIRHDDTGDGITDPRYGFANWLRGPGVFHDDDVYPTAWRGLGFFPYSSHTAADDTRFLYTAGIWPISNLGRCLTAMHYLHAHEDISMAAGLLRLTGFTAESGVSRTMYASSNWSFRSQAHMSFANCAFLAAACMLHRYAKFQGDSEIASQAQTWAEQAAHILVDTQIPWTGAVSTKDFGQICRPEHAGRWIVSYLYEGGVYKYKQWMSTVAGIITFLRNLIPGLSDVGNPPYFAGIVPSNYEADMLAVAALMLYEKEFIGDIVIATNRPPVAVATATPSTVDAGALVTLDGSGSSDPDGDTLTYLWEQAPGVGGGGIELSDPAAVSPTFTAPAGPAALTFKLTVTDGRGRSDSDTVTVRVRAPETWGEWADTGNTRGSGASREKEQVRTSNRGNRETRWVADPEPETWGPWSRTGNTRGSGQGREAEESRTSSYDNTQTRWVSDPAPETWGPWSLTGTTQGCGQSREAQESRTSNIGAIQTRWVSDPEPETWGPWTDTGNTADLGATKEQERTSSCGNRETKWVAVTITWGPWSRTGSTRGSCQSREAQESRTSNIGAIQTRWVSDPEPETWGPWTDTGNTADLGATKEQERTSNCGNRETRWVVGA